MDDFSQHFCAFDELAFFCQDVQTRLVPAFGLRGKRLMSYSFCMYCLRLFSAFAIVSGVINVSLFP